MLVCKRYCSYDLTVGNAEVSFLYEGRETTETLKCKSSRSIGEYEYIIGVIWVVANSSNVRLVTGLTTFWVRVLDYPLISTWQGDKVSWQNQRTNSSKNHVNAGIAQWLVCLLAMQKVVGSNPITRSTVCIGHDILL